MNLSQLIGNQPLKRTLEGQTRPPHAVILSGPRGSGRHTLATLLKQAYLCTGESVPCGTCPNCRKVREGIHPDVMGLDSFLPESELEKEVKVGTIRDIRADALVSPNQSERKVYLIDRPMNPNAQNAMLKLLEEGPAYAAFLLITENSAQLLETVRSRCARFQLSPVTEAETMVWLRKHYPEKTRDELYQAAQSCGGLLGRAAELLDAAEEKDDAPQQAAEWLNALLSRSEVALMECAAAVQTKKLGRDPAQRLYTELARALHEGVLCSTGMKAEHETAQRLAATFSTPQLLRLHALTEEARDMGTFNVAPAHSAGWLAVRMNSEFGIRNSELSQRGR